MKTLLLQFILFQEETFLEFRNPPVNNVPFISGKD